MSRFRAPFERTCQKHEEALQQARGALVGTVRLVRSVEAQRPHLESRLGRQLERLWQNELGLRPRLRFRKRLPELPRQPIGKRLRRFRRKRLWAYRKAVWRLGGAATDSWPARRRHFEIASLRFRMWLTPLWALVLLVPWVLLLIEVTAPSALETIFNLFTSEISGP